MIKVKLFFEFLDEKESAPVLSLEEEKMEKYVDKFLDSLCNNYLESSD